MDILVDNERMKSIIEFWQKKCTDAEAENARLKEENEIRDNLSEKFRKEALSWAKIANEYQKDRTKLEQTLQEIKAIAENMCSACKENTPKYYVNCRYCNYKRLLDLITKAESEDVQ